MFVVTTCVEARFAVLAAKFVVLVARLSVQLPQRVRRLDQRLEIQREMVGGSCIPCTPMLERPLARE